MTEQRFDKGFILALLKVTKVRSQFLVYERRLFTSKRHSKFVTLSQCLKSSSKYLEKQTNFKLSDVNNINNGITGKTKACPKKKMMKIGVLIQNL